MKVLASFILLTISSGFLHAGGGGEGDIATEGTQTANGIILGAIQYIDNGIKIASKEIKDFEEIANMSYGLADLPFVREMLPLINQAKDMVEKGNAIAYSAANLEMTMKEKYKHYEGYIDQFKQDPAGATRKGFEKAYKDWSLNHNANINNILKAQGFHASQFDDDEAVLQELKSKSSSSQGRMQVLQVGQLIATEEVNQLNKLKQIMLEQTSLHAGYFADKQARSSYEEAAKTDFYEDKNKTIIDNGKGYGR